MTAVAPSLIGKLRALQDLADPEAYACSIHGDPLHGGRCGSCERELDTAMMPSISEDRPLTSDAIYVMKDRHSEFSDAATMPNPWVSGQVWLARYDGGEWESLTRRKVQAAYRVLVKRVV